MGKRDDQRKLKLCVLNKIKGNKSILFGQLSQSVTKQVKIEKWKEVNTYAQSIGAIEEGKDWSYVRDVWWPNVRKASMEKIDNAKKTGTGGGKDKILNVVDEEVINIIGRDSPSITGLNVSESMQDVNIEPEPAPISPEEINDSNIEDSVDTSTSMSMIGQPFQPRTQPNKKKIRGMSEPPKEEMDEKKQLLQIDLLKVQIYKSKLEARKLELELGIPLSVYTKDLPSNDSYNVIMIEETTSTN